MDEKTLLERACDALRAGGAEGDAWFEHRRTLHILVREGKLEDLQRAEVRGLGIRAMSGGRLGFVHTSECDGDGVVRAAQKACELAKSASVREDLALAERSGTGDGEDEGVALAILDPTIERHTIAEKQEWARSVEAVARGVDPKIRRTEGATYDEALVGIWLANTNGLYRHFNKSNLQVGAQVIAEDKGELQIGEIGHETSRWNALPDPGDFGRRAGERAMRLLGGRSVPTGSYPVVFSPEAGFAVLVYLSAALNGSALGAGRSWLAGRTGEIMLGSPLVTVHDDGHLPGGPASVPFDGEGTDTRDTLLIDAGKVRGNVRDLAAAKRLGAPSTGNSRRGGYEQLPAIGSGNVYLVPGSVKADAVLGEIEKGFWIWGLTGWWIGLDPSNPGFSSAAFGIWIENGKPAQPVARVTVAGSLTDILSGIDAIADDFVWDHPTKTPTYRVKSMSVSGV